MLILTANDSKDGSTVQIMLETILVGASAPCNNAWTSARESIGPAKDLQILDRRAKAE